MPSNADKRDRLLDEALARYANEQPGPGLEARILDRTRGAARRIAMRQWAFALAAAACLFVAAGVWVARAFRSERGGAPPRIARSVSTPAPVVAVLEHPAPPLESPRKRLKRLPRLPKKLEFPGCAPLTPEESALLLVAQKAPRILLEAEEHLIAPIPVEEIHIQPLDSDGQP